MKKTFQNDPQQYVLALDFHEESDLKLTFRIEKNKTVSTSFLICLST